MSWIASKLWELVLQAGGVTLGMMLLLCLLRCYQLILRRGYYWYTGLFGCAVAAGIGSAVGVFVGGTEPDSSLFVGVIAAVSSGAIAYFIPAGFPRRSKRRAGQRSGIWQRTQRVAYGFAALWGIAATIVAVWMILKPGDVEAWLDIDQAWVALLIFLPGVGIGLSIGWGISRRAREGKDLNDTINWDQRRPVLYLRAFEDDERLFTWTNRSSVWDWSVQRPLSLEDYLAESVASAMGPFIALGSPDDYFSPRGAAREYVEDKDWRRRFIQLAAYAQAIIVSPSCAHELQWEFSSVLYTGDVTKLVVVLGPYAFEPPVGVRSSMIRWAEKFAGFPGWRPVDWSDFKRKLTPIGYDLPAERPSPASVIAFDRYGRAQTFRRRCQQPYDYVNAIKGFISILSADLIDKTPP